MATGFQRSNFYPCVFYSAGLPLMVSLMGSDDRDIAALAAEAVSHIAQFTRARRIVRHYGGICKLVSCGLTIL